MQLCFQSLQARFNRRSSSSASWLEIASISGNIGGLLGLVKVYFEVIIQIKKDAGLARPIAGAARRECSSG